MKQTNILLSVIVFATLTRIAIPSLFDHVPNFSALDALALFCGAYCGRRALAVAICLASVWIGDMLITHTMFYEGFYWQYGSYALITLLGANASFPRKRESSHSKMMMGISAFAGMTLSSALIFYIITNFGVWFSSTMYPHTADGLIACYVAAIPFFKSTVISDFVFSGVLFGIMSLSTESKKPLADAHGSDYQT